MHTSKNFFAVLFVLVLLAASTGPVQALPVQVVLPIADAGPDQSVATLASVTLDGSASTDPDLHLPLTYQWTQTGGTAVALDDAAADQPVFTAPGDPDLLTFSLVVTDDIGNSSPADEVVITVDNQPPVANAGEDRLVETGSIVTLEGAASFDPDDDLPLTFLWTQTGGISVTLDDEGVAKPTFTAPAETTVLTFSLSVTDSLGMPAIAPDEVVITVTQPPVANAGPDQTVYTSSLVTLDGTLSVDPDENYPLTYRWKQIGGPDVTLDDADASNPTFTAPSIPCALTFTLSVTDALGSASMTTDTVTITVEKQPMLYLSIILRQIPPAPFGKSSPGNGTVSDSNPITLSWSGTSPVTRYEYCYDTTNDGVCSAWVSTGLSTSTTLPELPKDTLYYWQVRAWNDLAGPTYADGSQTAYWSFVVDPYPTAFNKLSPTSGALNQSITPTLSWEAASSITQYQYCIDTTNDNACTTWVSTGLNNFVTLPAKAYNTTYYWQVRAWNGSYGPVYANGTQTAFWSFKTYPQTWTRIFTENFDGVFPGSWQLYSEQYLSGSWQVVTSQISWGKNTCKKVSGTYSARMIGGGSLAGTYGCTTGYPNNYYTEMVYGPLDLSRAQDGKLMMKVWLDSEFGYDVIFWGVSINGSSFYGNGYYGYSGGFQPIEIDLKNVYTISNVLGQPQVWVMVTFESDSSNDANYLGAWVDDLILSLCYKPSGCSGSPSPASLGQLPATLVEKPIFTSRRLADPISIPELTGSTFDPTSYWPKLNLP